jgi:hypothetical protein
MQLSVPKKSFAGLFGILICLSGCGADEATTSETASPGPGAGAGTARAAELDPCALVSQAEIEEIVGRPVAAPEPSTTPAGSSLIYYGCSSHDVHINVESWSRADDARSSFEMGTPYPPLDGLGHPARNTQPIGDVDVLVDEFVLSVDLFLGMDKDAELAAATEIARIAIGRMP